MKLQLDTKIQSNKNQKWEKSRNNYGRKDTLHAERHVKWRTECRIHSTLQWNGVFIVWELERTLKKHMRASQDWNKIFPET